MSSQYSYDGKYFAKLTADSKLKIWQATTGTFEQEFTPDFHLTAPCTCLHFVLPESPAHHQHPPRKKKHRQSIDSSEVYIALGTASGLLLVYSVSKAELDFTINSETNQSVSCVSWNNGNLLFSAVDCNIVSWNLDKRTVNSKWNSGNEKVTAIAVLPENKQILTASRNIKLWDVRKKEILTTFVGHSFEVSILHYIMLHNDGVYLLSGSKGDRLIRIWNIEEGDFTVKNAVANLLLEDIPVNISLHNSDSTSNLAVVTRNGVVHFYQHTLNGNCSKPVKPKTTIQVATEASPQSTLVAPIPILGVYLHPDLSLTIAHGNDVVLTFENVILNTYEKVQCLVRKDPHVVIESADKRASKIRTPMYDKHVHYVTPHTQLAAPKRKSRETNEVPMEKRLENLTLQKIDNKSQVPKSDNVAQLLIQGLHSKDKRILKSVLSKHDETIIKNTIKRLPMPVIVPFMEEITGMMQGKTALSQTGSLWLKHLLNIHTGLLLSNSAITDLLGPILGSIESRLSLLTPLNQLKGRLDLLVSQATVVDTSNNEEQDALLIYNDKDLTESDNEDMDVAPQSESDNEWLEESSEIDENNENDYVSEDDIEIL